MPGQGNSDGSVQASSERSVSDLASSPALPSNSLSLAHHFVSIKLTNHNYLFWRTQLTPFLRGQGLLGFADGTYPCPAAATPGATAPTTTSKADSSVDPAAVATARDRWLH